jgi:hypothetical protein
MVKGLRILIWISLSVAGSLLLVASLLNKSDDQNA